MAIVDGLNRRQQFLVSEWWSENRGLSRRPAFSTRNGMDPSTYTKVEDAGTEPLRYSISWHMDAYIKRLNGELSRDVEVSERNILDALRKAAEEKITIQMTYLTDGVTPHERMVDIVEPIRTSRGGNDYFKAFCHLRREVRTFRVGRIRDLVLTSEHFVLPAGG